MIEPEIMLDWLNRRIHSVEQWLETFSEGKKARPAHEVGLKQFDIQASTEVRAAYVRAVERRKETEKPNE